MTAPQFEDAWNRIRSAYADYAEFLAEIDRAMHAQMRRMIRPAPDNPGRHTEIRLLAPRELIELTNRPRVLAGQIAEHLRSALDYIVFHLSERNDADLDARMPAFPIADDPASFRRAGARALRYLTPEQERVVAGLQPYRGHDYLALIRDASNKSKHRSLLTLRNFTPTQVVHDDTANADRYDDDWWRFPQPNGSTVFVRRGERDVRFLETYDAVLSLKYMLEGARALAWAFERYLRTGVFPTIDTSGSYAGPGEDYAATVGVDAPTKPSEVP